MGEKLGMLISHRRIKSGYAGMSRDALSRRITTLLAPLYFEESWKRKLLAHSAATLEVFKLSRAVIKAVSGDSWKSAIDVFVVETLELFRDLVRKVLPAEQFNVLEPLRLKTLEFQAESRKYRKSNASYRAQYFNDAITDIRIACEPIYEAVALCIESEMGSGTATEMVDALRAMDSVRDTKQAFCIAFDASALFNLEVCRSNDASRKSVLLKCFQTKELFNALDSTTTCYFAMFSHLAGCLFDRLYTLRRALTTTKDATFMKLMASHEAANEELTRFGEEYLYRFREVKAKRHATKWYTSHPCIREMDAFKALFTKCNALKTRHVEIHQKEQGTFTTLTEDMERFFREPLD